ncbi:tyrosine phosphatase family protein [Labrys wisconsinensis]|uniref:Rhodanese domain-containing protein n=1 Tax=Labrys wisconsinensis TaxID=425677 RepID=A0ABU0JAS2_9HYPH|nr:protein tyrosine phosphatase [Labrys wisconsinensis]MDQ0470533.1 putative protein tyrosine phosphatase [Labrys wisconsinensis]
MRIHVCSLARLEAVVAETGARHLVTLINAATPVTRPASISPANHLFLGMNDIPEPMEGHVAPGEEHLEQLLAFLAGWDRTSPLVVHCWAGVSRSTAAAYVAACALDPARDEMEAALALRRASPTATPNPRIVALADARLNRGGRMIAAIAAIGRGADCHEGTPFAYEV